MRIGLILKEQVVKKNVFMLVDFMVKLIGEHQKVSLQQREIEVVVILLVTNPKV